MRRTTIIGISLFAVFATAGLAECQVSSGEQAPLYRGVDSNGRLVDMEDFIDGTPMLFLYTSAT